MRGFEWSVDLDGFNAAMEEQKAKARKAWSGSGDSGSSVFLIVADRLGATEFLDHGEETNAEGLITAMIKDDVEIDHASP